MTQLLILAVVGLVAQFVDGSLGMAYGVTSTTLLLTTGVAPAAASATVHLSEIGTTLVSGIAHWRFGNVDWRVVSRIAVPGALGAFIGATVLSSLSTAAAEPIMSGILLALGLYVLVRFTARGLPTGRRQTRVRTRFLAPLGLFAGFVDATGGGGWGPVATPALLAGGRVEPRKVIGSVDTSEFLVAIAAGLGFLFGLGAQGIPIGAVIALLVGGVLAAPLAAWVVRRLPGRLLGSLVGGMITLTNARTILLSDQVAASGVVRALVYAVIVLGWSGAVAWSFRAYGQERRAAQAAAEEPVTV